MQDALSRRGMLLVAGAVLLPDSAFAADPQIGATTIAAIARAVSGRSALVVIETATAFAASWKPFVKSKPSATMMRTTRPTVRISEVARPGVGRPSDASYSAARGSWRCKRGAGGAVRCGAARAEV